MPPFSGVLSGFHTMHSWTIPICCYCSYQLSMRLSRRENFIELKPPSYVMWYVKFLGSFDSLPNAEKITKLRLRLHVKGFTNAIQLVALLCGFAIEFRWFSNFKHIHWRYTELILFFVRVLL